VERAHTATAPRTRRVDLHLCRVVLCVGHGREDVRGIEAARAPLGKTADADLSLKWKPPSENSIDFKAELRFPPHPHNPNEPDFQAVPTFLLYTWLGKNDYEFFDEMEMEEEEWERYAGLGLSVSRAVLTPG